MPAWCGELVLRRATTTARTKPGRSPGMRNVRAGPCTPAGQEVASRCGARRWRTADADRPRTARSSALPGGDGASRRPALRYRDAAGAGLAGASRPCSVRRGCAAAFGDFRDVGPLRCSWGRASGVGMAWPLTAGRSPRLLTGMQPCQVRLGGRPRRAERGDLVMPERRDDAPARQIRLPVVRVLADRPGGRPPVFRPGGDPGLTNMRFGCPPALAAHDVILVGYRGVDGSVRLDAPEVAVALRAGGGDLLGLPSRRQVAQAAAMAARRLRDSGVDVAGYTVAESLADLDDARTALGYERIDLLSESYGTAAASSRSWSAANSTSQLRRNTHATRRCPTCPVAARSSSPTPPTSRACGDSSRSPPPGSSANSWPPGP